MKGGFDLYGTYYPNRNDAINAEISQCNEIDNRHNRKKIEDLERKLHEQQRPSCEEEIHHLWQMVTHLEERIAKLENQPATPSGEIK
jgi:polyhydroxyalkanoate synthesis regulator phasin